VPLPTPVGRQCDVLYFPGAGHIVVLGTAGSGKTTLAIHRANYLANVADNKGRVLLVTFNGMLTTYLNALVPEGLRNVDVRTYGHFARGYLRSRGKMGWNQIVGPDARSALIERAVALARRANPESRILQRAPEIIADEMEWISRMGVRTAADYRAAERVARAGVRITRAEREHVWDAHERYRSLRKAAEYRYDWDDLAVAVEDELAEDDGERMYRHVVIDEGQDFSPSMLRSLVAAVPDDGTVTFFGDTAQQIYGSRVTWRNAGLDVDHHRILHFKENYRNTQQIAAFALSLARGPYFEGTPDMVEPRAPKASGSLPIIVEFATSADEKAFVIDTAARLGRTRSVAVLLRDRVTHESYYLQTIGAKGARTERLHKDTSVWDGEPRVWIGTYHAAKGLEFDAVLLPHLDDNTIPDAGRIELLGDPADVCRDDVKLLYVASTRARAQLVLTYHGTRSRLLDDIDSAVYQGLRR
jgi:superfamily I DNA/RNA helicase